MTGPESVARIRRIAEELGFDRLGIARAKPPPRAEALEPWLASGHAGRMDYLQRHVEIRKDPQRLLPGARSVICVAMKYQPPGRADEASSAPVPFGRIATYARGQDYHDVLRRRLDELIRRMRSVWDQPFEARPFVDTAPVLERSLAAAAGVGWIGKNSMLIVPKLGSYVFLGGAVTTLPLEPDDPLPDRCGTCRKCIDACPTGAIVGPYVVDASKCISYLTIELRGAIAPALRACIGDRLFGCDACQRACPHNRRAPAATEPAFADGLIPGMALVDVLRWDRESYLSATRRRATRRAKLEMLRRNAAIVLGNVGGAGHLAALRAVIEEEDRLLTEHAAWATDRIRRRLDGQAAGDSVR